MKKNSRPKITALDTPEILELTQSIARLLEETDKRPLFAISAVIAIGGPDFALKCLIDAATMKRDGLTMKTDDGTRYRSLGGMFFKVAKNGLSSSQRYRYMSLVSPNSAKRKNGRVK